MPYRAKVMVRDTKISQDQNRQVQAHARDSRNVPQNDGRSRTITIAANSSQEVAHTLNRIPKGFNILSGNNNQITDSNRTKTSITLTNASSSPATIEIWIF